MLHSLLIRLFHIIPNNRKHYVCFVRQVLRTECSMFPFLILYCINLVE